MKKSLLLGIVVTLFVLLSACATNRDYQKVQARSDLIQENWMKNFNMNPKIWTSRADRWFYTDYPNSFNQYARDASPESAITAAQIRVSNFTRIKVEGPYLVQIYGSSHNSVFVLGANDQVRHTQIQLRGNALYIRPAPDCNHCGNLTNVIVRIGVRNLDYLYHAGTGLVEGKNIRSRCLVVKSSNTGSVLLAGNMNVTNVVQGGTGTITIIGVYAPSIAVTVLNNGNVNLSGRIGINHIIKRGFGCLNIQGADSDCLRVDANNGLTTISGSVNLQSVNTTGLARVYMYWVNSRNVNVNVHGNSRLGMAGSAHNMNIAVDGNARYEGKCMHSGNIYVNTAANGHANVSPVNRLYSDAKDYSTIYFFSSPGIVARYNKGQGYTIPIFGSPCTMCAPKYARQCIIPAVKKHRRCAVHKTYKVKKPLCQTPKARKTYQEVDVYHGEKPYTVTHKTTIVKPATTTTSTTTTTLHPRTYKQYKTTQSK